MEYNNEQSHESLNNPTPEEYRWWLKKLDSKKMCGAKMGVLTMSHFRIMRNPRCRLRCELTNVSGCGNDQLRHFNLHGV